MIFTPINGTCSGSFADWSKLETELCKTGGNYHCISNEKGQYGEVCTTALWIESNLCPEYNTKANRLDAKLCNFRNGDCPTKDYLSNKVYDYSACFSNNEETETSTPSKPVPHTTQINSTDDAKVPVVAVLVPVCIVALLCITAITLGIIVYRRRKSTGREVGEEREEERMIPQTLSEEIENQKQDTFLYWHTRTMETRWKEFCNAGVLIIVGLPGSGKTNLGLKLGSYFRDLKALNGKYTYIHILHGLENLEDKIKENCSTYLLLDDCLEKWNFQQDQSSIKDDIYNLNLIYEIHTKRNKELFIVLTVNTHTCERFSDSLKDWKMFSPENILELSYEIDDKKEIFKSHIKASKNLREDKGEGFLEQSDTTDHRTFDTDKRESEKTKPEHTSGREDSEGKSDGTKEEMNFDDKHDYIGNGKDDVFDIDEKTVDEVLQAKISTVGFPECCYLFCRDRAYVKIGSEFFEKPNDCLVKRFQGWLASSDNIGKSHICTLGYAVLHGGIIDVSDIDYDLLTEVVKICKLDIHNHGMIRNSVQYLSGIYLTETEKDIFVLQHDTVAYAVLRLMIHTSSNLVLNKCEPIILTKFVRLESYKDKKLDSEMVYRIGNNHAKLLAKRLAECATNDIDTSIYMQGKYP